MVERKVSWEFLFIALLMTGAIMGGIFYVGNMLSDQKVSSLSADIERFAATQSEQEMSRRLARVIPGNNCHALDIAVEQTASEVRDLQETVATHEEARKIDNAEFRDLKKQYMTLLLERYLTTLEVTERCDRQVVPVLYLYEDTEDCARCDDQGIVLTDVLQERDDMIVFPLDTTLGMQPIDLIVESYNVTTYPSLIVGGERYGGFQDRDTVADIVDRHAGGGS